MAELTPQKDAPSGTPGRESTRTNGSVPLSVATGQSEPAGDAPQAEAAASVAATWVREHLADRIELRSNEVGDLAFFERSATSPSSRDARDRLTDRNIEPQVPSDRQGDDLRREPVPGEA
jgi:hypothetical protein